MSEGSRDVRSEQLPATTEEEVHEDSELEESSNVEPEAATDVEAEEAATAAEADITEASVENGETVTAAIEGTYGEVVEEAQVDGAIAAEAETGVVTKKAKAEEEKSEETGEGFDDVTL